VKLDQDVFAASAFPDEFGDECVSLLPSKRYKRGKISQEKQLKLLDWIVPISPCKAREGAFVLRTSLILKRIPTSLRVRLNADVTIPSRSLFCFRHTLG
jgi:hypothetical protein